MKAKHKTSFIVVPSAVIALAFAGTSLARTWTSADGTKTFEGDFVSATETKVTVKRAGGGTVTFAIDKLSADDQEFVREQAAQSAADADAKAASEKLKSAPIPKALDRKLVKLDGKRLKRTELGEVIPEYYFLAYSASW